MTKISELKKQIARERAMIGKELKHQKRQTRERQLKSELKFLKQRKIRKVARKIVRVARKVTPKKATRKKIYSYLEGVGKNISEAKI